MRLNKYSFTSNIDYNTFINNHSDIFLDYSQTFDLIFIIDRYLKCNFKKHYDYPDYVSIGYDFFNESKALLKFNRIHNFRVLFEMLGDIHSCNAFTEKTLAYKLKQEFILELMNIKTLDKLYKYTKDKFKMVKIFKYNDTTCTTKKELMNMSGLNRGQLDRELWKYSYEIKELFREVVVPSIGNDKFISYKHKTKIDINKCRKLKEDLTKEDAYKIFEKYNQMDILLFNNIANNFSTGEFDISYQRKASGRLVSSGGNFNVIPMQTLCRELRSELYEGQFSYDINNSAPTILSQLAMKYLNLELPNVQNFVNNKTKYRQRLVDMGFTADEAKGFYIAIFFGASLENHSSNSKNSWYFKFGVDKIKMVITECEEVLALYLELKSLTKKLGLYLKKNKAIYNDKTKSYILNNMRGSSKVFTKWSDNKALVHTYFGVESVILDKLISKYEHTLLLFDAFISDKEYDIEDMSKFIFDETGFSVKFSKELIGESL